MSDWELMKEFGVAARVVVEKKKQEVAKKMNIQALIDAHLRKKEEEGKARVRSGKWNPSSFGFCYRRQYWNRKNETPTNPPDARTLRLFAVGRMFEDWVAACLGTALRKVKVETQDIRGEADFIVTEEEVVELKTQHSRAFWYMHKKGYDITVERRANILQLMTYVLILGKTAGRLVFISKDDLCIEEYAFQLRDWKEAVLAEMDTLNTLWLGETLPAGIPRAYNGKECKYCQFFDLCLQNGGPSTME